MHSPKTPHWNHEQFKRSRETINDLNLKIVTTQELIRMKIPPSSFAGTEIMKSSNLPHAGLK
ncbi:MAG: hypothetical protein CMN03_01410 [Roseibacillus sp.]|nr:hypothetical protein [Roseibacillus sp.]